MKRGLMSAILLYVFEQVLSASNSSSGDPYNEFHLFDGYYKGREGIKRDFSAKLNPDSFFDAPEDLLKWPDGIVYFQFPEFAGSTTKERLNDAIEYVQNRTCVRFQPCSDTCSHKVIVNSELASCESSTLGRDPKGTQYINVGPNCWKLGQIVHELMHVLGFPHEHQRPDRDTYISISYGKILPKYHKQFDIIPSVQPVGKFNFASIMMYPPILSLVHSKGLLEPYMKAKISSACSERMGYRQRPTAEDVRKINLFYDCKHQEDQCDYRPNHQIIGATFASHTCYTVAECCDLCSHSPDCVGFTWLTTQGGTCLLQERVDQILWVENMMAGVLRKTIDTTLPPNSLNNHPIVFGRPASSCRINYDCDRHGNDLLEMLAERLADCKDACEGVSACVAFTFNATTCWLKHNEGTIKSRPGYICGTCRGGNNRDGTVPTSCQTEQSCHYLGKNLASMKTSNLSDCVDACEGIKACNGFVFIRQINDCQLKISNATQTSRDQSICGICRKNKHDQEWTSPPDMPTFSPVLTRLPDGCQNDALNGPSNRINLGFWTRTYDNVEECRTKCTALRDCKSYFYFGSFAGERAKQCQMKRFIGDLVTDPMSEYIRRVNQSVFSGVCQNGKCTNDRPPSIRIDPTLTLKGVADRKECSERCLGHARCKAYVFTGPNAGLRDNNICYLKPFIIPSGLRTDPSHTSITRFNGDVFSGFCRR